MTTALFLALVASGTVAGSPGEPAPRRDLPRDLEQAPWEALYVEQCKERLTEAGLTKGYYFSRRNRLQERKRRGWPTLYCHAPQATIWTRGPTGVKYMGFTLFNCAMALAMTDFEKIAQQEAKRVFDSKYDAPIRAITHMGSYNCRRLRKKPDKQSHHSFGNALDIKAFWIRGVGEVDVKRHWTARIPARAKKQEFLRALSQRLKDEQVFTNVLDPTWDRLHTNHIHVDLAPLSDGLPSPALARVKAMPTGQAPTSQARTGQAPTGQARTGQAPTGQAPTSQAPTGQARTGQAPTSAGGGSPAAGAN